MDMVLKKVDVKCGNGLIYSDSLIQRDVDRCRDGYINMGYHMKAWPLMTLSSKPFATGYVTIANYGTVRFDEPCELQT